jgi:hypothetical protein
MSAVAGLKPGNGRLGGADPLGDLCLRNARCRPSFQKLIEQGKLFFQFVVFSLYVGAG